MLLKKFTSITVLCLMCMASSCNSDDYPYAASQQDFQRAPNAQAANPQQQQYQQPQYQQQQPYPQQGYQQQAQPAYPYQQQQQPQQYYYPPQQPYYSPYQSGGAPASRLYSNPYAMPPSQQMNGHHDADQYYVPPTNYQNVESSVPTANSGHY